MALNAAQSKQTLAYFASTPMLGPNYEGFVSREKACFEILPPKKLPFTNLYPIASKCSP